MSPQMEPEIDSSSDEFLSSVENSDSLLDSDERDSVLHEHLQLLNLKTDSEKGTYVFNSPVFTEAVRAHHTVDGPATKNAFTQYGLLGGQASKMSPELLTKDRIPPEDDPRIYYNVAVPSSVFICGSQGSGKSHTLSCLLENSMVPSTAAVLPRPLTGLVFHYDTFSSDHGGAPCEAAYLSSNPKVNVRVVCAPTNIGQIKRIYSSLPNVEIQELRLLQTDLNTKRMLDLMAVSNTPGTMPLYLHVVVRILRDLRIAQQKAGTSFNYGDFKRALANETMTREQLNPLQQRLETLESFMVRKEAATYDLFSPKPGQPPTEKKKKEAIPKQKGTIWKSKPGQLTIVDLSCPCVTPEMACAMFNMCLDLFLEQDSKIGRIVALDEAHKYMTDSGESLTLTESLLSAIRLQRHLGTRVIISTQEPTISPRLLDLCTVTIVHKFTSPEWLRTLKKHLAGASLITKTDDADTDGNESDTDVTPMDNLDIKLLSKIIALNTGEALLFCPNALIGVKRLRETALKKQTKGVALNGAAATAPVRTTRLGHGILKIRIRKRVTRDGGKSIMAV